MSLINLNPNLFTKDDIQSNIGYSIDFAVERRIKNTKVNIQAQNITSSVLVKYLMNYKANATSKVKYLGDDGYYHIRPTVVGKYTEQNSNHILHLPKIYLININYEDSIDYKLYNIKSIYCDFLTLYFKKIIFAYSPLQRYYYIGVKSSSFEFLVSTNFNNQNSNSIGIDLKFGY